MAVKRFLPNTDAQRALAMDRAALKITLTAPADVVFSAQAQALLPTIRTPFNTNLALRGAALAGQVAATPGKDEDKQMAGFWLSHFIEAHDKAAKRGETGFVLAHRSFFQLDATNEANPPLVSDEDVYLAGERILTGNVNYLAAGHPVILFPTIANVTTRYNTFAASYGAYNVLKQAYDDAQEAISSARPTVDGLILRMWNEAEAFFSTQDAASKRRHCRSWGVVYVLVAGTQPTADDFSIIGTITDSATGLPVTDVNITVLVPETIVLSDDHGKYYVPVLDAGSYTLLIEKPGYQSQTINSVVVNAGALTTLNISLVAGADIVTVVRQGDLGLTVSAPINVDGINDTATTQITGETTTPGAIFEVYSATNVSDPPSAPSITITFAIPFTLSPAAFRAAIGLDATRPIIIIKNTGAVIGHWKFTFVDVTEG